MESSNLPSGDLESTLKIHARELAETLEQGRFDDAARLVNEMTHARDRRLYQEVGKLTRELHSAIVNFQIDPRSPKAEEASQIADATERLAYVVRLTETAANRTMDLVEESVPVVQGFAEQAATLSADWQNFMQRRIPVGEFRGLVERVGAFLASAETDAVKLSSRLNDIMLAQDYQDLTGQVIKRVTALVTDVEADLLKLVLMASEVDRFAGIEHDADSLLQEKNKEKDLSRGEGPQIHADKREDVVSGQDDVDDLLSSLGF